MSELLFSDEGAIAPPRLNGELVFASPWESRVFGVAAALRERGLFTWDEFRVELIAAISEGEPEHEPYYASWQRALERLVAKKGLCSASELEMREHALAARPAGHDHR
jgi:nitrile hydratase accessory protein